MRKLICILIVSVSLTAYAQVKEIRPVLIKPLYLSQAEYDSLTEDDIDEYSRPLTEGYWYAIHKDDCSWIYKQDHGVLLSVCRGLCQLYSRKCPRLKL